MSFGIIVLLVVAGTTIWVGVDAPKRDWKPGSTGTATWVVGCLLLWIIIFPAYLIQRSKTTEKGVAVPGGGVAVSPQANASLYRACPHCKEPMRRDASVCPHCRMPSAAWTFHESRWWQRESAAAPWQWLDERTGTWTAMDVSPSTAPAEST